MPAAGRKYTKGEGVFEESTETIRNFIFRSLKLRNILAYKKPKNTAIRVSLGKVDLVGLVPA
jgi:hypothetical protein